MQANRRRDSRDGRQVGQACQAVLEALGHRLTGRGDERRTTCPSAAHADRTPSFDLNINKGLGYCRSCEFKSGSAQDILIAAGDAADFKSACEWLESRGIDSGLPSKKRTAAARLANAEQMMANYTADEQQRGPAGPYNGGPGEAPIEDGVDPARADLLLQAYGDAAAKSLANGTGGPGRDYLTGRGLAAADWEGYELGFAAGDGLALLTALKEAGATADEVFKLGLARRNDKRTWAFFRDRVMMPVHYRDRDGQLRLRGFVGRALKQVDDRFKYLNQPGLPSSQSIYGLKQAAAAAARDAVFICEGPLDVVQCAKHGLAAVGLFGKSMSADQAALLFGEFKAMVICLDGDSAGRSGAVKAVLGLLPHLRDDHQILLAAFPEGEDPDSFLRARGRDAMLELLDDAATPDEVIIAASRTAADFVERQVQAMAAAPRTRARLLEAVRDGRPPSKNPHHHTPRDFNL